MIFEIDKKIIAIVTETVGVYLSSFQVGQLMIVYGNSEKDADSNINV